MSYQFSPEIFFLLRYFRRTAEEKGAQQGKKETVSLAIHKEYRLLLIFEDIGL